MTNSVDLQNLADLDPHSDTCLQGNLIINALNAQKFCLS